MKPGFLVCFLVGTLLGDVHSKFEEVQVFQTAILSCKVEDIGNDKVQWFKKPSILLSNSVKVTDLYKKRMSVINPYHGEWKLVITRTEVTDAGGYKCQVGHTVVAEIELVVLSRPRIDHTPNRTFNEGETGIIWCNASGSPTPDISWYSRPPHQVNGIEQDTGAKGNKFVLINITRYYDNIYVCRAINSAGNACAETRVHVNFGPEVNIFEADITAAMGEEVMLHCAVVSYPMDVDLEWAFQNKSEPITDDWKYEVNRDLGMVKDYNTLFVSLKIRKDTLGNSSYGQYVCRTKNFSRGYSDQLPSLSVVRRIQKEDKDNSDANSQ